MVNGALLKRGFSSSWKMLLIFAAVLTMYFTIIISMFDPELGSALNEFAKVMPELMAIVGMNPSDATLAGFMSAYLYGFIMLVIPMLFSIMSANKLMARHIDRGSMTFLLSAPVERRTVAVTQMLTLIIGITSIILYAAAVGITAGELSFPGELDIGKFLLINCGALGLQLFIGGICFLASCIFNDAKYAVGVGAGIPALMLIIQMMANSGDKFAALKFATFFSLFNTEGLLALNTGAIACTAVLFIGAALLYLIAIRVFCQKDLHI